jgi:hypothetical protein
VIEKGIRFNRSAAHNQAARGDVLLVVPHQPFGYTTVRLQTSVGRAFRAVLMVLNCKMSDISESWRESDDQGNRKEAGRKASSNCGNAEVHGTRSSDG